MAAIPIIPLSLIFILPMRFIISMPIGFGMAVSGGMAPIGMSMSSSASIGIEAIGAFDFFGMDEAGGDVPG